MTSNDINELEKQVEDSVVKCYCSLSNISPGVTTGIAMASALTTATILSPKIRKITIPLTKFVAKQQIKLLAGIGVLSVATYITNSSSNTINTMDNFE